MRSTRRQVLLAAAAGALEGGAAAAASSPKPARPNIVFILADDLGYADLSCYGSHDQHTPLLDRLASEGVRLTQAYANSAVCSATRTALITGRYQYRLPVGLQEPVPEYSTTLGLPPSHPTLPSLLRDHGYQTWLIGKWHLGAPPAFGPLRSGYDHFLGFYQGAADYFTHGSEAPGQVRVPYDGLFDDEHSVERPGYLTNVLLTEAERRIRTRDPRSPFLLSLHFNAPHWPWETPEDDGPPKGLASLRDYRGGSLAIYARMVQAMDAAVGRLMATLEAEGLSQNTLVVFTSDNGGERFSEVWPFVGMKGELLEGGLRIPAIVRWPGRMSAGSTTEQVAASMDWLPTLLAAAGGVPDANHPSDGINLLPMLEGGQIQPRRLFWRYHANDQAAVRDGDWKYLKLAGQEHLFDVVADAHERAELSAVHPAVFARLKAEFAAWNATMLPYPGQVFSETPKGRLVDRY